MHVRNRGTIVEFLVHSDPLADYQGVDLGLEVTIVAQESSGEGTIDQFVFYRALGNRSWKK